MYSTFLPRTMYDFGFCAMDILQAVAEDSGLYEVRATNRIGTATSSINIEVKRKCLGTVGNCYQFLLYKN